MKKIVFDWKKKKRKRKIFVHPGALRLFKSHIILLPWKNAN